MRRSAWRGEAKTHEAEEHDDVEAYLRKFERMMAVFEVEHGQWSYMLAPQLMGKAQKAFAALEDGAAGDYDALRGLFSNVMALMKRPTVNA